MKLDFTLTMEQQALVEANLSVIDKTINLFINPDEDICDLGRSDLYQEGAIALCKAAATYDGKSAQFDTYATTVMRSIPDRGSSPRFPWMRASLTKTARPSSWSHLRRTGWMS